MEHTNVYTTQKQRFNLLPCSVADFRNFNTCKPNTNYLVSNSLFVVLTAVMLLQVLKG